MIVAAPPEPSEVASCLYRLLGRARFDGLSSYGRARFDGAVAGAVTRYSHTTPNPQPTQHRRPRRYRSKAQVTSKYIQQAQSVGAVGGHCLSVHAVGHRRRMLLVGYTAVGIGRVQGSGDSQLFGLGHGIEEMEHRHMCIGHSYLAQ